MIHFSADPYTTTTATGVYSTAGDETSGLESSFTSPMVFSSTGFQLNTRKKMLQSNVNNTFGILYQPTERHISRGLYRAFSEIDLLQIM